MQTPYSSENQKFSDNAHVVAQKEIYPVLFPRKMKLQSPLQFTSTSLSMGPREKIYDGEKAIDRLIQVHSHYFMRPFSFSVQERFRRVKYEPFQDLTVTLWNDKSSLESEAYKIQAGYFVYGYFDENENTFRSWVLCNTTQLMYLLTKGKCFDTQTNHRSDQTFVTVPFDVLRGEGIIVCEKRITA